MGVNNIDVKTVAKSFGNNVTQKLSEFFETQLKSEAQTASRRRLVFRAHGKTYSYGKYKNTGQLASNIRITRNGDNKAKVSDGTRANYSKGYHGMYFLVEKKGENAVKRILKNAEAYTRGLKL